MIFIEEKGDLFEVDEKYYLGHCISSDAAMGVGIALEFVRRFDMKRKVLEYSEAERQYPTCILVENTFNIITKKYSFHKPTYDSMFKSLVVMKDIALKEDIKFIAIPLIGCGVDKLYWNRVKEIIKLVFDDTDITILVRVKD